MKPKRCPVDFAIIRANWFQCFDEHGACYFEISVALLAELEITYEQKWAENKLLSLCSF